MEVFAFRVDLHVIGSVSGVILPILFLKKDYQRPAHPALAVANTHFLCHGNGGPTTDLLGCVIMLPGHFVRRGAGAAGIGENVHIRKITLTNKGETFRKFLLRLSGKGHDHVRGHGALREKLPKQFHAFIVPGGIVFPFHPLQNRVAAGLHGQVKLGTQVGKHAETAAESFRHHSGFQRPQPYPQIRHRLTDFLNEQGHLRLSRQVNAPAGNFNAGHHDLPVAPLGQRLCLGNRHLQRGGTNRPPGVGDDAVGAEIYAAVLHLQHGPGALFQPAGGQTLEFPAAQGVVHLLPVGVGPGGIQEHLHKFLTVSAAADDIDAQRPNGLRVVLGIAAAHRDHRIRVVPPAPADYRPVLLVRHGGDGAGVDHIAIARILKGADFVALFQQQALHGLGLILICLAAQCVKSKLHLSKPPIIFLSCCINRPNRQLHFTKKTL